MPEGRRDERRREPGERQRDTNGRRDGDPPNLDHLKTVRSLGRGAFGQVRLCHDLNDNHELVAVKMVDLSSLAKENRKRAIHEARLLRRLSEHANIVNCREVFIDKDVLEIVLEFAPCGDLDQHCRTKGRCSERTAFGCIGQISAALAYVHAKRIMHRDLKPANLLLFPNGIAKLADFGVCFIGDAPTCGLSMRNQAGNTRAKPSVRAHSIIGTPSYFAPELVNGETYGAAADMWSLGVCLYECLAFPEKPFTGKNLVNLALQIVKGEWQPLPADVGSPVADRFLSEGLLLTDPKSRLKAAIAVREIESIFLHEFGWEGRPGDEVKKQREQQRRQHLRDSGHMDESFYYVGLAFDEANQSGESQASDVARSSNNDGARSSNNGGNRPTASSVNTEPTGTMLQAGSSYVRSGLMSSGTPQIAEEHTVYTNGTNLALRNSDPRDSLERRDSVATIKSGVDESLFPTNPDGTTEGNLGTIENVSAIGHASSSAGMPNGSTNNIGESFVTSKGGNSSAVGVSAINISNNANQGTMVRSCVSKTFNFLDRSSYLDFCKWTEREVSQEQSSSSDEDSWGDAEEIKTQAVEDALRTALGQYNEFGQAMGNQTLNSQTVHSQQTNPHAFQEGQGLLGGEHTIHSQQTIPMNQQTIQGQYNALGQQIGQAGPPMNQTCFDRDTVFGTGNHKIETGPLGLTKRSCPSSVQDSTLFERQTGRSTNKSALQRFMDGNSAPPVASSPENMVQTEKIDVPAPSPATIFGTCTDVAFGTEKIPLPGEEQTHYGGTFGSNPSGSPLDNNFGNLDAYFAGGGSGEAGYVPSSSSGNNLLPCDSKFLPYESAQTESIQFANDDRDSPNNVFSRNEATINEAFRGNHNSSCYGSHNASISADVTTQKCSPPGDGNTMYTGTDFPFPNGISPASPQRQAQNNRSQQHGHDTPDTNQRRNDQRASPSHRVPEKRGNPPPTGMGNLGIPLDSQNPVPDIHTFGMQNSGVGAIGAPLNFPLRRRSGTLASGGLGLSNQHNVENMYDDDCDDENAATGGASLNSSLKRGNFANIGSPMGGLGDSGKVRAIHLDSFKKRPRSSFKMTSDAMMSVTDIDLGTDFQLNIEGDVPVKSRSRMSSHPSELDPAISGSTGHGGGSLGNSLTNSVSGDAGNRKLVMPKAGELDFTFKNDLPDTRNNGLLPLRSPQELNDSTPPSVRRSHKASFGAHGTLYSARGAKQAVGPLPEIVHKSRGSTPIRSAAPSPLEGSVQRSATNSSSGAVLHKDKHEKSPKSIHGGSRKATPRGTQASLPPTGTSSSSSKGYVDSKGYIDIDRPLPSKLGRHNVNNKCADKDTYMAQYERKKAMGLNKGLSSKSNDPKSVPKRKASGSSVADSEGGGGDGQRRKNSRPKLSAINHPASTKKLPENADIDSERPSTVKKSREKRSMPKEPESVILGGTLRGMKGRMFHDGTHLYEIRKSWEKPEEGSEGRPSDGPLGELNFSNLFSQQEMGSALHNVDGALHDADSNVSSVIHTCEFPANGENPLNGTGMARAAWNDEGEFNKSLKYLSSSADIESKGELDQDMFESINACEPDGESIDLVFVSERRRASKKILKQINSADTGRTPPRNRGTTPPLRSGNGDHQRSEFHRGNSEYSDDFELDSDGTHRVRPSPRNPNDTNLPASLPSQKIFAPEFPNMQAEVNRKGINYNSNFNSGAPSDMQRFADTELKVETGDFSQDPNVNRRYNDTNLDGKGVANGGGSGSSGAMQNHVQNHARRLSTDGDVMSSEDLPESVEEDSVEDEDEHEGVNSERYVNLKMRPINLRLNSPSKVAVLTVMRARNPREEDGNIFALTSLNE